MNVSGVPGILAVCMFACATAFAFVREREELGCSGTRCDDRKSVYIRGTEPSEDDTPEDAIRKLSSILSYHEKGGIWKRCFLIAVLLSMLGYVVFAKARCLGGGWSFAIASMVFFSVLYFEKNFENFHHHRELMRRGFALLSKLRSELIS